ncbi:ABC transporter ATP-binding protein [Ruicaihuangia caeni]|uniref:ABC transporter ATP-binding protein n=1 Tax=Ruicaihuangia caeni TaxID=3042517 RepID=A0AAW6T494_9MICO|nr:ABC transporter ATP-binding protein [Klugiella sp. YN-L-19]MDI2097436.1 ABC transporter ATP-binding protein [Klugiella sp. YN-L-19]
MPQGRQIAVSSLTKRFGPVEAVSNLSFSVEPGRVTGFLGPNGAGKTTTLRMLLGLVAPTSGTATIGGERYRDLDSPLRTVGTSLEASSFHPGRSARNHLAVYADAAGIPITRVDEVLELVGLGAHSGRRVGGYSLGMRQRLGLAFALLGDPEVLILDEPINGLDPEGIRWIRVFLRELAAEGRTVLVSSHLLSEVQQTVDEVVIIAKGRLVYQGQLSGLGGEAVVMVDAPERDRLRSALAGASLIFSESDSGFAVRHTDAIAVGALALASGVALRHLADERAALEQAFLELVQEGPQA